MSLMFCRSELCSCWFSALNTFRAPSWRSSRAAVCLNSSIYWTRAIPYSSSISSPRSFRHALIRWLISFMVTATSPNSFWVVCSSVFTSVPRLASLVFVVNFWPLHVQTPVHLQMNKSFYRMWFSLLVSVKISICCFTLSSSECTSPYRPRIWLLNSGRSSTISLSWTISLLVIACNISLCTLISAFYYLTLLLTSNKSACNLSTKSC